MFTLPDLPYDFKALEPYIDEETMHLHHDKHHATYVTNLNDALKDSPELLNRDITDILKGLDSVPENVRMKVRNNGGGHANHSFFWEIMSANPKSEARNPNGELLEQINKNFGSFEEFKEKFGAAGLGRFGSGWIWLIGDEDKLEIIDTPNQDNPWMENRTPILGLDVWEHAYYLRYKNVRADYIKNWWNIVNWSKVSELFLKS